jgi:hypothetical protein
MAERALPVLFDNLAVYQPPHLCVRAELAVSPGMMGVFDPLHAELIRFSDARDWLPPTAGSRTMDGAILIAAKFHWISSRWLCSKENGKQVNRDIVSGGTFRRTNWFNLCDGMRNEVHYV